jgi:hypothetical protein
VHTVSSVSTLYMLTTVSVSVAPGMGGLILEVHMISYAYIGQHEVFLFLAAL